MIPLTLLNRFALPFLVATLYLGDVNMPEQVLLLDKTMRLADQVVSQAKGEGVQPPSEETFDYIIIGAGSAGAIVANRLSAEGTNKVLILEAGGDPNPVMDLPYGSRFFWQTGIMNWGYSTVKQNSSCLASDGICPWPRGKTLGGTSQINGLMYNRGMPKDYDLWAEFSGDHNWKWENVKESYNRIESYHGYYEDSYPEGGHGSSGEMWIGNIDHIPGVEVAIEALKEKGIPIGDLNSGELTAGFSKVDFNIKNGFRSGTYQAFLEPILNRTNLIIYRYAYATKINFEGVTATGVTYERHGEVHKAFARKEVILCGGAVESPKLLMLSGIGPREDLENLDIPVILDLPVGKYLQEHPGTDISDGNGGFLLNTTFGENVNTTGALLQFLHNGTGPMGGFVYGGGFTSQLMWGNLGSSLNEDSSWPEVHVYIFENYKDQPEPKEVVYLSMELLRSGTMGSIKLASKDPSDKPLIDPNFFEDETDLDRMVDVLNVMLDVMVNSTAYKRHGIQMIQPLQLCLSEGPFLSREYWKCYIRQNTWPSFHPTSTCRMGPDGSVAVVDAKLKVFGTANVRVIDASVMPFVPSGNTNMPSMLVGQRGAEIILGTVAS